MQDLKHTRRAFLGTAAAAVAVPALGAHGSRARGCRQRPHGR